MSFALCPDDGPPRLIRFVEPGALDGRLALLDKIKNLLFVDRVFYEQLTPREQAAVLRTLALELWPEKELQAAE